MSNDDMQYQLGESLLKMALPPRFLSATPVATAACVLRLVLLCWGRIQDVVLNVKFTDVDYFVFTDAARFVVQGESPFKRSTYRYSPLISILLVPNVLFWEDFGKVLFALCDLLAGWLIYRIVQMIETGVAVSEPYQDNSKRKAILAASMWLFNPLVAGVSVRGNAESVMSCLVLGVLHSLLEGREVLAAVLYGASVHLKLYPVMYSVPIMMHLSQSSELSASWCSILCKLFSPNYKKITFIAVSLSTFMGMTGLFFAIYGEEYINEAFLYHFVRRDTRHNFSIYFYMFYLVERTAYSKLVGFLVFIPQALLCLVVGVRLHRHLHICWFVQTVIFVTFNKICTSQYFLWYLTLLPLIMPHLKMSLWRAAILAGVWFGSQGLWLGSAYLVEFQGLNVFLGVWAASVVFFASNIYVLVDIVRHCCFSTKLHSN